MAAELEKLSRQYPHMKDIYGDLADRVRSLRGPEHIMKAHLPQFPSIGEIGEALINEGYRTAGLFVLNATKWISAEDENRPKIIQKIERSGPVRYLVTFEAREIVLSGTELRLLDFFSIHPNQVFSKKQLGEIFSRYNHSWVGENIYRLRKSIEHDPTNPTRLVTVGTGKHKGSHGYMYRLSVAM